MCVGPPAFIGPPRARHPACAGMDGDEGEAVDDLRGRVALVTGASRGVGAAVAVALAEAGCHVACAARSTRAAPQRTAGTLDDTVAAVEDRGARALAVPTNLAQDEDVVAMVARTVDHFGRLDVLVNNAAITFVGDLDIGLQRYDLVMQVNLRAPLIALRESVPHLRVARRERRQRLVGGCAPPLSVPHGLRHVEDRPRATHGRCRRPAVQLRGSQ